MSGTFAPLATPMRQNTNLSTRQRLISSLEALVDLEETNEGRVKLQGKVTWFGDTFRIKGSTIPRAWKAVIIFTIWATIVAVADFVYERALRLSNSVVPLLSVVVGLMLVFRNTTAFARWNEGSNYFSSLQSVVRNLARDVWVSINQPRRGAASASQSTHQIAEQKSLPIEEIKAKARCLRLLVAFVIAVKRHVRGQYGIDYEDLRTVLPVEFYNRQSKPGFGFDAADADVDGAKTFFSENSPDLDHLDNGQSTQQPISQTKLSISQLSSPKKNLSTYARLASIFFSQQQELSEIATQSAQASDENSPLLRRSASFQRFEDPSVVVIHNYLSRPSLPLPLVVAHQIHLYISQCNQKGYLDDVGLPGYSRLIASVTQMTDLFSRIEGLAFAQIPACYCIHLKQCTSLYLFALPLTLASELGWTLIPFVTIVAFTLVGIESLARECEDPFGTDPSDLPLDYICGDLRNEIEHLIAKLGSDPCMDLMF
ncbi:hypothetical protein O181_037732 [Austropuccinia psidii MF-1]|uniref:Uncharacterized protein n=1 Tax=Austropuccinia psidii MF-1 TaxID=1389203 RepID=A0A9Q3DDC6_9BASI|nr:hypothetical protein [Austropuccinia psidii MF-1]